MKNFAHLKPESPFYPLFSGGLVPIRNILVSRTGLMEGDGVQEYYDVDVPKLSETQRRQIATMVSQQCGGTSAEVEVDMISRGVIPLRAKHVRSVSTDSMAFL